MTLVSQSRWNVEERVKLCNCAGCGKELLGDSMQDAPVLGSYRDLEFIFRRIPEESMAGMRRPYCRDCVLAMPGME